MAVSGQEVVIGTGARATLQLIAPSGSTREIDTGIPARRSTEAAFAAGVEEVLASVPAQVVPRVRPLLEGLERPEMLPAYEAVKTDECGRLWIAYRLSAGTGFGVRVVSPTGLQLGDAKLSASLAAWEVYGGFLTGVVTDEDGGVEIHSFRVRLPACAQSSRPS
jgi:hypothetical protein